MKIIVTGFNAFDIHQTNPTELLCQKVTGIANTDIENVVLETCCTDSWHKLEPLLKDDKIVLLMLGLADSRNGFSLERVALNLRDYRVPDNNDHEYDGERISEGEEQNAFFSDLPLRKYADYLTNHGFPCHVSNHAGAFVCNDLYFRALEYKKNNDNIIAALFVHVPLPAVYAESVRRNYAFAGNEGMIEGRLMSEQAQLDYMAIGLRTLLDQILAGRVATA
ncbi:MAG: hypothetical protein KIT34_01875 [Cyanobacteria bacterium TGS_CYA1]|nr:hypothetical protein [Cyanobacteria bacterium TGS_CYA1]